MGKYDYKNNYEKDNYFKLIIRLPKEKKEVIEMLKETTHKSTNRLFIEAVERQHNVDLTLVMSKLTDSK